MSVSRYYREELDYLKELGAEFARRNPNLAPFLARDSFDPDVERLLEGFAFLTGRLRQKLDDELPELSQSVAQIVAPQLLAPTPAMTVVQFQPSAAAGRSRATVRRGTELGSRPIRGVRCRFQTCYDVALVPLKVVQARSEMVGLRGRVRIVLALTDGATWGELGIDRLRIHLATVGRGGTARSLYAALRTQCQGIGVDDSYGGRFRLPASAIRPAGFAPEESVLPHPERSAQGLRLFQEYFAFPDKFMFLDIVGLEPLAEFSAPSIALVFDIEEPLAEASALSADHIRLNATVAVNLFPAQADPIHLDHRRSEYRLTARDSGGNRHVVHSVREVVGYGSQGPATMRYAPLESFSALGGPRSDACYSLRRRVNSVTGEMETFIAIAHASDARMSLAPETLSVATRCTNGAFAAEIPAGHLDQPIDGSPNFASFRDIQPVRPEVPVPLNAALMRRVLATLASGFASMLSITTLQSVMATCNPRAHFDQIAQQRQAHMAAGLRKIEARHFDWVVAGCPVRGRDVHVEVQESRFGGAAEAYLFFVALAALFDDLAAVNSVHRLTLVAVESNRRFEGAVRDGQRATL